MATDEAKKMNALRMTALSLQVLATEVWDSLGESSLALSKGMGDALLEMMEKEQGLEIAAENLNAVDKEIERILVDEYGIAKEITIKNISENNIDLAVRTCGGTFFCDKMIAAGLKVPFTCPVMLATSAAMRQLGYKGHVTIERWQEGKGCIIHFFGI